MRSKVRTALILAGLGSVVLLGLVILTAMRPSWPLAIATGAVGLVLLVGAGVATQKIADRAVKRSDLGSTRLRHLEDRATSADKKVTEHKSEIAALRKRVGELEGQVDELRGLRVSFFEAAVRQGRDPRELLTEPEALELFAHYIEQERYFELAPLIRSFGFLEKYKLGQLRVLYRFFRDTGYWDLCIVILSRIAEKSKGDNDRRTLARLKSEVELFRYPLRHGAELPKATAHDPSGPILHMVGRVLSETQSGYTLRTQYTALAQLKQGLPVVVVGQCGISPRRSGQATKQVHEGVQYYLLSGPERKGTLLDEWITANIERLGELVRELRPSVLHAHSDFHNAVIAHAVGSAYDIPVVYETRGFWEESWLSRTVEAKGWNGDPQRVFAINGRPEAYELRHEAEEAVRARVQRNVTLARVMRRHIVDSAQGEISADQVSVVPNAVDPEAFPVQQRDPALAARLGIPADAVTIGYISSMVSYEGIDTLIDAFDAAGMRISTPMCLVLVGGGAHLKALRTRVKDAGITNVVFTGAVPHEEVLAHYGLIDIFVVPRKKSAVADLVTPLKPFEALSTGRAVVVSDVKALREIARDCGAAEVFRAGDVDDLSRVLIDLVEHPQKRHDMGARAARWVREHRTWDENAVAYARIYRELGYSGPMSAELSDRLCREASPAEVEALPVTEPARLLERGKRGRRRREVEPAAVAEPAGVAEPVKPEVPLGERPLRVVVVAMKPQIAGRIRRNIQTLLDMGAEVVVVNSTPRDDFFQDLAHPNLTADFVDVRSLAVRYQARMTRQKNERQAAWDRKKLEAFSRSQQPQAEAPAWMSGSLPGASLAHGAWTSECAKNMRSRVEQAWKQADKSTTKALREARTSRDLTIRDQLKQVHLINRFEEFWRLSPERIAAHAPDLVVSSDLPGLVGASIAAKRLGVPHIHDCHELYLESTTLRPYERTVLRPVEKRYMRRADSVLVVNQSIRDEYARRYGVRGKVLRNCAPAVSNEVRRNPVDLRELAGIPADAKVVLYQGGLVKGRGLDVCIRAVVDFPQDTHLVLIGKGRLREELEALAVQLGVQDRVRWLPAVAPGELPAYTVGADLGVIPYQPVSTNNQLALPNKVFEYTAAGIPFVAADLPEVRRLVQSIGCGEVYDPFTPSQLAAAVRTVLAPENYEECRKNADLFGRENTWQNEREILESEVRSLTGWPVSDTDGAEPARNESDAVEKKRLPLRLPGRSRAESSSLKIAMVVHNAVRHDARVLKSAASLKGHGHDVRIFGLSPEGTEDFVLPNGVPVHLQHWDKAQTKRCMERDSLPKGKEMAIRASFRAQGHAALESVRRTGFIPDTIHIHDHVSLTAAERYKSIFGVPIVWDAHEIYEDLASIDPVRAIVNSRIVRESAPQVDGFITLNESIANFYRDRYAYLPQAVLLPNAVEKMPKVQYDGRLHAAAGLHERQKILLFQGGFSPHRGIPALLEASRHLNEEWSLVFMGWGKLADDIARHAEDATGRPPGKPRVSVVPGAPHSELLYWTAGAALGTIPYENTGLNHLYCSPNKLWEYPAAGVPILATDMPEMQRKIEGYGIGLTVAKELKPEEIARSVNALTEGDLERMKENCYRYSEVENWQEYEPKLVNLHQRLSSSGQMEPWT